MKIPDVDLACNNGGTRTTALDVYMPIEFFYTVIVVVNNYTHAVLLDLCTHSMFIPCLNVFRGCKLLAVSSSVE